MENRVLSSEVKEGRDRSVSSMFIDHPGLNEQEPRTPLEFEGQETTPLIYLWYSGPGKGPVATSVTTKKLAFGQK